ncbi:MAG: flagellar basal body protein FliL [Treponema sp.]|nr:flagellar basal body protein FliL [Treponema sp.]
MGKMLAAVSVVAVLVAAVGFGATGDGNRAMRPTEAPPPAGGPSAGLSWFTEIGPIDTQTWDTPQHMVSVAMRIGFEEGDSATLSELSGRRIELRDFTRRYFAGRSAEELRPENEARIRMEIIDMLNTRYLAGARVRAIAFDRLDVMETF